MLAIAIINYNKYDKTVECVESVLKTVKSEYRIYLLDNASQNESFDELAKLYSENGKIELIKSEENLGYARGNNLLLERAEADGCDYVLISNNDIIFNENAVDLLLEKLKKSGCFITSPKIMGTDGRQQASVKAVRPSYREYILFSNYVLGNLVSKKKMREYMKKMTPKSESGVYWASGACFMADMKQFKEIGYFDPYTFLYFEEYIISEKALKKGLKLLYCPGASVIHFHGASTGGSANLFTRLENFRSESYMFSNYYIISNSRLRRIRRIRCLEVLFTFTKQKKIKDALKFVKESKRILNTTPKEEV
ncbi:MAG: glycosyltransferase family 2 protein [Eubacterium sp.]|nr:glycosyltransferase family 2 protein [Eubacterium sp.]